MRLLGRPATTFPGRLALGLAPDLLARLASGRQIILVTGTNGKTTTVRLLARIFQEQGRPVIANYSGANLESGLVATLMENSRKLGKKATRPIIIFEIDEAYFARLAGVLQPAVCVVTNIFRDQQDRLGDPDQTRHLLARGLDQLQTVAVLCADDPLTASLGRIQGNQVFYFGLAAEGWSKPGPALQLEAPFCIFCQARLTYTGLAFAQLGQFNCPACGFSRPRPDLAFLPMPSKQGQTISFSYQGSMAKSSLALSGLYNAYNAAAALLAANLAGLPFLAAVQALGQAGPAFGRQERFQAGSREVCLILVKNPAGMEQALAYVDQAGDAGGLILLLNDAESDGRDLSWIWDLALPAYLKQLPIGLGGSRRADLALRLHYEDLAGPDLVIEADQQVLFKKMLDRCPENSCLYILPNYTALMSIRQELAREFQLPDFNQ